jgi:hypothetical protein
MDLAGANASPSVRAYVAGYEGEPLPSPLPNGGRTGWEILGAVLLAIIGVVVRFRFASNIWRRNVERPKKPKAQQVYEQTRDLEKVVKREKQPVTVAPEEDTRFNQHHVDNLSTLHTLQRPDTPISQAPPKEIDLAGVGGASPAVVTYVWRTMAKLLPKDCNWMVYGRVALVHPEVGLVFCVAMGRGMVVMRLPEAERKVAIAASPNSISYETDNGKIINAQRFGPDWVFVGKNGHQWVRAAYDYTGQQGRRQITREDYY